METLNELAGTALLGNSLTDWALALLAFAATAVGVRLFLRLIAKRLAVLARRTETTVDDTAVEVIQQTRWWMLFALGLYGGSRVLVLPEKIATVIAGAIKPATTPPIGTPVCLREKIRLR